MKTRASTKKSLLPRDITLWRREHLSTVIPGLAKEFVLSHLDADTPIIGLTGALGSGCSFFAQGLNKFHKYHHSRLSDIIHKLAKLRDPADSSFETLQNIGNRLRLILGHDVLVQVAMRDCDEHWGNIRDAESKPSGI